MSLEPEDRPNVLAGMASSPATTNATAPFFNAESLSTVDMKFVPESSLSLGGNLGVQNSSGFYGGPLRSSSLGAGSLNTRNLTPVTRSPTNSIYGPLNFLSGFYGGPLRSESLGVGSGLTNLSFGGKTEVDAIPQDVQESVAEDMPLVESFVPTSNVPGAPVARIEAREVVQDRVATPEQVGDELRPDSENLLPERFNAIAERKPFGTDSERTATENAHEKRVTEALRGTTNADPDREIEPDEFYYSDLFSPDETLSESYAADRRLLTRMREENRSAMSANKPRPYSPVEIDEVQGRIYRAAAINEFVTRYASVGETEDGKKLTRKEVEDNIFTELLEVNNIVAPDDSTPLSLQREYARAEAGARTVIRTAFGKNADEIGFSQLPARVDEVFTFYKRQVGKSILAPIAKEFYTQNVSSATLLPGGISATDETQLTETSNQLRKAAQKLELQVGSLDDRVLQLYENADSLKDLAAAAPARADARRLLNDPFRYIDSLQDSSADGGGDGLDISFLAGLSSDSKKAYRRDLALDYDYQTQKDIFERAVSDHESNRITDSELETARRTFLTQVTQIAQGLDPIVKKTWYGSLKVSGMNFDFEKLAGMSALILGLYEATYGKERAREQNLEDMMALERFRTDERLRLYSGQVAARGGGGSGTSGTAPAGSSALASIAERVS